MGSLPSPAAASVMRDIANARVVSLAAFRQARLQPHLVRADFGRAAYHDAVIREDQQPRPR